MLEKVIVWFFALLFIAVVVTVFSAIIGVFGWIIGIIIILFLFFR